MQGNIKVFFTCFFLLVVTSLLAQKAGTSTQVTDTLPRIFYQRKMANLLPLGKKYGPLVPSFQLAKDQVVRDFAFFCKKEWQFEKKTAVAFKFRLGSVEQTDYWEGKTKAKPY